MNGGLWVIRISDFLAYIWMFLALTVGYGPRRSRESCALLGLLYAGLGTGLILAQEWLHPSYAVYLLTYVLCGVLYGVTALKGQNGLKTTTAVFYCTQFFLLYDVVNWVTPMTAFHWERVVQQALHLLLMAFVARRPLNARRRVPTAYWLPILLVCALMMVLPLWPKDFTPQQKLRSGVLALCMIAALHIVYTLSAKLIRDYERSLVEISMQDGETALRNENARLNDALRRQRHELRNHAATLTALLEKGRGEEALRLIQALETAPAPAPGSGNAVVDAILARYAALAREKGIDFRSQACLDVPVSVSDTDLSSLLNNLLSNAFEASRQVEQPRVEARVLPAKDYLYVFVRNRADARRLRANPLLHTTKQNPALHGIGLQVVREIAEKYHGWVDISAQGEDFTVQAMLLMEE